MQSLDIRALKTREATAISKAQESEAKRGKGVTQEAQDVFDAFNRTMPTRWDGSNIIVADAVSITAPYRVDDCRPLVAGDVAALNHVRKVVCFRSRHCGRPILIIGCLARDGTQEDRTPQRQRVNWQAWYS